MGLSCLWDNHFLVAGVSVQATPNMCAGPSLTSPLTATHWGLGSKCWPHGARSEEETWDEAMQVQGADLGQSGRELRGWGTGACPLSPLSLRGEAQRKEAGKVPPKRVEPQGGPPTHVSGSQDGVKGQWRVEGPGGGAVVGGCLVRDAQGLRWNSGYGIQGTMEVTGVKLVRTQWALRSQESQDAQLLLIWASGRFGGNTEMEMVERTGFEGAMNGLTLKFSRGRRLQDPQRERSGQATDRFSTSKALDLNHDWGEG